MKRAILVGNGINFSGGAWAWPKVVKRLADNGGLSITEEDVTHIPLPLLADRVLHRGGTGYDRLFAELEDHLEGLPASKVHRKLLAGDFPEILTTNYDLSLEKAVGLSREDCVNAGWVKETKYSQFRHVVCPNKVRVWHVHGDITRKGSLLLGYERYAGYLQVIRQTMTESRQYRDRSFGPWRKLVDVEPPPIWPAMLFSHRVLILGLGMDFAETHLWWLLSYRAGKRNSKDMPSFPQNEVAFVWNTAGEKDPRHAARARQLEAFGVRVVRESWDGDDWSEGYCDVLERFAEDRL